MSDNIYYQVTAQTPAAKVLAEWQASVAAQREWLRTFAKNHQIPEYNAIVTDSCVIGISPAGAATWATFCKALPLWREVKGRGCSYFTPRKVGPGAKELHKEWSSRPKVLSMDWVKSALTRCVGWTDWMEGLTLHNLGFRIQEDGSAIVVLPYCVTKSKVFKPIEGMSLGEDQPALRDAWHKT